MGMEGKLRQVSEFELAAFRKDPRKLYSDLLAVNNSPDLTRLNKLMREFQSTPLAQRIRQRAASGQPPLQEDLDVYQKQMEDLLAQNKETLEDLHSMHMGLSKDGKTLSLHKSWHCLHYLFTGKSWEPAENILGKAIMGGKVIPDVQQVMGYGPAKYLTPAEAREVAEALEAFPIQEKAESFDAKAAEAADVYVPHHEAEELVQYFQWLREFYRDAAGKSNGMILWVE